jgi:ATP/maltotriose-dependent transcriptional regulator MalT
LPLIERAVQRATSSGRTDLEARCLSLQGFALGMSGRREEGIEIARRGLSLALADKHFEAAIDAHWVLGTIANHWADYQGAESAFEAAIALCQTLNKRGYEQLCVSCVGIILYNRGEWDRAEQIEREVLASRPSPDARAHAFMVLGLISAARGATKRARSMLGKALALARDLEHGSGEVQSTAGLALVDELEGTASPRWHELLDSPPPALRQNYGWWVCRAATFAARRRDATLVRACADALAAWASRFGGAEALAGFAHVLGEVALLEGDPERAVDQFGRALELMADVGAPFELAHTQMRAGVAMAERGEREAGVDRLVDAYRTFRKLGARPFWLQAAAEVDVLGERVDRRLGRRAAKALERGGLTRRELDILRRVAVGRTNREIARELVLSPRTVDMHVRHVLTKLGCRTRTEATSQAYELHLLEPGETA